MRITLTQLRVITKQTIEVVSFSSQVTFIHGPVSTVKSTVARLIDYCMGGKLERTPEIRSEFVSAALSAQLGAFSVLFERGADDPE